MVAVIAELVAIIVATIEVHAIIATVRQAIIIIVSIESVQVFIAAVHFPIIEQQFIIKSIV
jgi:hypothetical protein